MKRIFVVPDPAMADLPLSILLTESPKKGFFDAADANLFRDAPWLIKDYSLSILPSVGSMRALRVSRTLQSQQNPFFGVGDPILLSRDRSFDVGRRGFFGTEPRGASYLKQLSLLEPLPETAEELKRIAKILSADEKSIQLGSHATERMVKTSPLDKYRVVAFATHGLMANELEGLAEPGLVLTHPPSPTEEDDGVLTASEIATLKMNAEWVLLSACNTASADSNYTNTSFGGLVRSFFYAGARSLLVSHWKVASKATVDLTTETVRNSARRGSSQLDAHRNAVLSMISSNDPVMAHPSIWAAFSLVGAGETR